MGLLSGLTKFDSFARSKEHVQVRTLSGASGAPRREARLRATGQSAETPGVC